MREIMDFIKTYTEYFLMGLSGLILILLICNISLSRKIAKLNRRRGARLEDGCVGDIVDNLMDQSSSISVLQSQLEALNTQFSNQNAVLSSCLQKIGVVRFNAFEDVGGEQSFAIALLDSNRNGVVISSIYGRQDSRLYSKKIINGEGERALSEDEKKALNKALNH